MICSTYDRTIKDGPHINHAQLHFSASTQKLNGKLSNCSHSMYMACATLENVSSVSRDPVLADAQLRENQRHRSCICVQSLKFLVEMGQYQ